MRKRLIVSIARSRTLARQLATSTDNYAARLALRGECMIYEGKIRVCGRARDDDDDEKKKE